MPSVVVLDVVGSNRSLASPAPVAAYSSEIQQPIRAAATLGRRQHPYWAAPLDRDQDRAGSLHPDGQGAGQRPGPKRARRTSVVTYEPQTAGYRYLNDSFNSSTIRWMSWRFMNPTNDSNKLRNESSYPRIFRS
jgi:hypothetical protein